MPHKLYYPFIILAFVTCSSSPSKPPKLPKPITLFVTAELQGHMEPCGCTTDPLGDIARTAKLIQESSTMSDVLFIDAGSTLYPGLHPAGKSSEQEKLKAKTLTSILTNQLDVAAVGLGPYDFAYGGDVLIPRLAGNVSGLSNVSSHFVKSIGTHKVGILGATSKNFSAKGATVASPIESTKASVAALKAQKVELIVAVLHMPREEVADIVRAVPGIDVAIAGQNCPEPKDIRDTAQKLNDTWILQPANRGQSVVKMQLSLEGKGPLVDAVGKHAADAKIESLTTLIDKLRIQIPEWQKSADADATFIAQKQQELSQMQEERKQLQESPLRKPAAGNRWFTFSQMRIKKSLACRPDIVEAKNNYAKAAGAANVLAGKDEKPATPEKGKASYVGMEACEDCHDEAVEFWKTTKHANAWATLEKDNKQFDFECIGCHVTGWDKPGGSNIGFNDELRNVQCENCHGPGSIHAEDSKPSSISLHPEESLCVGCHNAKHSDTFEFTPYLRDVTGKGHAEAFRKKLGDGVTGLQLRTAGLEKAGKLIGESCPK